MAEDNAERELGTVAAEQVAAPAATAVTVATTASTSTTPFGYSQAQADALITSHNALLVDVDALRTYLGTIHTAASAA